MIMMNNEVLLLVLSFVATFLLGFLVNIAYIPLLFGQYN